MVAFLASSRELSSFVHTTTAHDRRLTLCEPPASAAADTFFDFLLQTTSLDLSELQRLDGKSGRRAGSRAASSMRAESSILLPVAAPGTWSYPSPGYLLSCPVRPSTEHQKKKRSTAPHHHYHHLRSPRALVVGGRGTRLAEDILPRTCEVCSALGAVNVLRVAWGDRGCWSA